MRTLFQTIPDGCGRFCLVRKNALGEFVVRLFLRDASGYARHYDPATSYETDLESACGTALAMAQHAAAYNYPEVQS